VDTSMDNGQMLQVRFISLNLREAGSNDVGRSEIGLFETLGMSIEPRACLEASER